MVRGKRNLRAERHDRVRVSNSFCVRRLVFRNLPLGCLLLIASSADLRAAALYSGGSLEIRWDNTLRYSAAVRLSGRDPALVSDPNADDGERNFQPGIVSNRLDIVSQLDLSDGRFGIHASAAGWYDTVYHARNDNDSPGTFNPDSVPHDRFTRDVRSLHGSDIELLDAFVHGGFDIGENALSFRLGRQTTLWGESLFFAKNGIAAAQGPVDEIKDLNSPIVYAKEIFLPVAQATATLQTSRGVTFSAYYQFEWRKDRVPGAGSYFSALDYLDAGGERYILAPGQFLLRSRDQRPKDLGQFGIAVQFGIDDFDIGLYALRFDAKNPEVYLRPVPTPSASNVGDYSLVFPQGISLYGASFSGYAGDLNLAGELSLRTHAPLAANPIVVASGAIADNRGHPRYPIGDTMHFQISTSDALPRERFFDSADLGIELAASERLSVSQNASALDSTRTPFALSVRASFVPHYFEVLPGLDLSVPLGVGYGLAGNSSVDDSEYANAGDVEIGLGLTFRNVWSATLSLTQFIGSPDHQALGDRDFVSFSVQRTF
jgi:hypothetical protein